MRISLFLGIFLTFFMTSSAQPFGEGRGDRGERRRDFMRRFQPAQAPSKPELLVTEMGIFVFQHGIVAKLNKSSLTIEAKTTLEAPAPKENSNKKSLSKLLKKMDQDGDGVISQKEFLGKEQQFDALDKDGDGSITNEELNSLEKNLNRNKKRPPLNGPATMKADGDTLILMVGNHVFKLNQTDLSIVAQNTLTELQPKREAHSRRGERRGEHRGERGGKGRPFPPDEGKRDDKEEEGEDF